MLDLTDIFATFPTLKTERTVLREATIDDTEDIFRIMSDADVMRYLGRPPMALLDDAVERIQSYQVLFEEEEAVSWVITHAEDGQVMGTCLFWHLNRPHFRAEIGYILGSAWWGKGIMTEVGSTLLDFGFSRMGLHSIEAQLDPDNTASRRLLEKLGFVQEGHFRENFYDSMKAEFTDTAVYSLLKSVWMSRSEL
jgi:ribosomal-protein-alanine N-acetyltransferase